MSTITPKRKITTNKKVATAKPAPAAVKAAPKPKAETPKTSAVAKPSVPLHNVQSDWTGPSGVVNDRVSRTSIDPSKFGTLLDAKMTDRDRKALQALRDEFGGKQFQRSNVDAGILRRLGERGYVEHVSGNDNAPDAVFRLTKRVA